MSSKRRAKRKSFETASLLSTSDAGNFCDFMKGNKKPLIAITTIIFVGFSVLLIMLYLDHEGFWETHSINKLWFSQSLINTSTGLFPLWLNANTFALHPNANKSRFYLYRSQYTRNWSHAPLSYNYSTLRTQSQLIYNFATAYNFTNNHSYCSAMNYGIEVLLNRYHDTNNGGFYYAINETNHSTNTFVIDYTKDSTGHSLLIYALSTAWLVNSTNKSSYMKILNETYTIFTEHFMDEYGGIHVMLSSDWKLLRHNKSYKSLSPLMYHFEALLQLYRVANATQKTSDLLDLTRIKTDIANLYHFVCGNLLHNYTYANNNKTYAILFEEYNTNWTKALVSSNASLGNAFKWSYLIAYMMDIIHLPQHNEAKTNSTQILQYALDLGYDKDVIYDWLNHSRIQQNRTQSVVYCNAIKTLYYYWKIDSNKWWDALQKLIQVYHDYYYDATYGGIFYSRYETLKGNVSKVDSVCIDMILFILQ